ncbi:MAG TPA: hypothetical protein VNN73_16890 [Blastocatellia bacterium]|nr:hypothetical protein [Blastocatellia bacterium]
MLYRKHRVGQEINSYCGKCKIERTHIVAAMDGDIVRRVTCSMCNSTHNFKPVSSGTTKPAATVRTTKSGATRASRRTKESTAFAIDPKRPVKSYDMNTSFAAGDVINHPKFGLGAVESSLPPNKIEVRFQEGKKLLLHNMKNFRA